ncbi:MAG: hypothetical protein ABR552_02305 [Actinomycetota bacterium]
MNKDFFANLDRSKKDFAGRESSDEEIGVEITLATGRTFEVIRVIDAQDSWVQIDGRDMADAEEKTVCLVVPYFQINFVQLGKQKPRRHAGFVR